MPHKEKEKIDESPQNGNVGHESRSRAERGRGSRPEPSGILKILEGVKPDIFRALGNERAPQVRDGDFNVVDRILKRPVAIDPVKSRQRAMRKKLIHPKNAEPIIEALPIVEGDRMHAVVGGDFIFGDLVTMICARKRAARLLLATLSASMKNIERLIECLDRNEIGRLELLISHYFVNANKKEAGKLMEARARIGHERMAMGAARMHAKVTLFDFGDSKLVIESSANLRSSDNVEHIVAICDSELFDWHAEWISKLMTKPLDARSRVD